MKIILVLCIFVILRAKAWSAVRVPFEFLDQHNPVHTISDLECVYVAYEEGDYSYKKVLNLEESTTTVCGLYVVADPAKIVEISIKYLDASCDTGALLAFFDGWELQGKYFPNDHDHPLTLDKRVTEFCNHNAEWPFRQLRKRFRSSQNAALLQYRIPIRGSFVATVKFYANPEPCNILADGPVSFYSLSNFGHKRNCTITAINPSVITLRAVDIGAGHELVNYDCDISRDRLDIGGSKDFDSSNMQLSSSVCGHSEKVGPVQGIFCEMTTARLISHGNHNNHVILTIRTADEMDSDAATLDCPL